MKEKKRFKVSASKRAESVFMFERRRIRKERGEKYNVFITFVGNSIRLYILLHVGWLGEE